MTLDFVLFAVLAGQYKTSTSFKIFSCFSKEKSQKEISPCSKSVGFRESLLEFLEISWKIISYVLNVSLVLTSSLFDNQLYTLLPVIL